MSLEIIISLKPLSVNQAYKGKLKKRPALLVYEKALGFLLPRAKVDFKDKELAVEITYGFSSRGSDIDNPNKPLIDALSKKYGFNDNQIYNLRTIKTIVGKGKEFIKVSIRMI